MARVGLVNPNTERRRHSPATCHRVLSLLFVALVFVLGCVPENVLWLPDSSGLVFSDRGGSRLVQYDFSRKAYKVIVADTKTQTPWPAIRSDTKRLAVAKCLRSTEKGKKEYQQTIQIVVYDLTGQELSRSSVYSTDGISNVASDETETHLEETAVNWSGPANKILVQVDEALIYDLATGNWNALNVSAFVVDSSFGVRPDGKGFLAADKAAAYFVDWDGWMTKFANLPAESDKAGSIRGFRWDGKVARLSHEGGDALLDTATMTYKFIPQSQLDDKNAESNKTRIFTTWTYDFPNGNTRLCLRLDGSEPDRVPVEWVEIQMPKDRRSRAITKKGEYHFPGLGDPAFFPSPDGTKVAICALVEPSRTQHKIIIVDDAGTILATLNRESVR